MCKVLKRFALLFLTVLILGGCAIHPVNYGRNGYYNRGYNSRYYVLLPSIRLSYARGFTSRRGHSTYRRRRDVFPRSNHSYIHPRAGGHGWNYSDRRNHGNRHGLGRSRNRRFQHRNLNRNQYQRRRNNSQHNRRNRSAQNNHRNNGGRRNDRR